MTIAVTGATGGVGSRVLRHVDARPITRAVADYDDPAALRRAFRGVGTLVFISSDGDGEVMRRHHEHVVAAVAGAGVEHVVYTSVIDIAPDSPFYYAPIHRDTEAGLTATG